MLSYVGGSNSLCAATILAISQVRWPRHLGRYHECASRRVHVHQGRSERSWPRGNYRGSYNTLHAQRALAAVTAVFRTLMGVEIKVPGPATHFRYRPPYLCQKKNRGELFGMPSAYSYPCPRGSTIKRAEKRDSPDNFNNRRGYNREHGLEYAGSPLVTHWRT